MTVRTGTAVFHSIVIRFDSASHCTPKMFTIVNTAISAMPMPSPRPVSAPSVVDQSWPEWSR